MTRKELASAIFDLYGKIYPKNTSYRAELKANFVKHTLKGDLNLGYASHEYLTAWYNRLMAQAAA